ncbi:MAG: carboxypeptidase-like regulatory domain-containing protein [Chthoniobacterales bacterium]
MSIKYCLRFSTVAAAALSASLALAQTSTLQGDVKGVDGRAAKGAKVRLDRQDRKMSAIVLRTDAAGRFLANNLPPGSYKVSAIVTGGVTSPVQAVKLNANRPVMVSLDLRGAPAGKSAAGAKKKKKYVWVPEETGSHLGGRYVEVDDDAQAGPSAQKVERASTKSLERIQNSGVNQSMGSGSR